MKDENTKPQSNSQRAHKQIRSLIFNGDLPSGSDHLETELAYKLGMSRTPVREAALMLEAQGLVEVRPRKGLRIVPVSPEDMREIYDILTELESLAAEVAAQAGYASSELDELESAVQDMEQAVTDEDLKAWAECDDRFHKELVRLGKNGRVCTVVGMMSDQVRRARNMTLFARPMPVQSNKDHRAVFHAIRDGNPTEARERHRKHRQQTKLMLIELIQKLGFGKV